MFVGYWGKKCSSLKKDVIDKPNLVATDLSSLNSKEWVGICGNFQCVILTRSHHRLFCDIIKETPAWNEPQFDAQKFALINLCQSCTYN